MNKKGLLLVQKTLVKKRDFISAQVQSLMCRQ